MTHVTLASVSIVLLLLFPYAPFAQVLGDARPELLDFDDMVYPPIARAAREQGVVVVRLVLDERGRVAEAVTVSGRKLLDTSALTNAKQWRFKPGTGREVVLVYSFEIIGTCTHGTPTLLSISHSYNFVRVITCAEWQSP